MTILCENCYTPKDWDEILTIRVFGPCAQCGSYLLNEHIIHKYRNDPRKIDDYPKDNEL